MLITDGRGHAAVEPLLADLPDLETIVLLDDPAASSSGDGPTGVSYSTLSESDGGAPEIELGPADAMSIVYTSGTTGLPKGCVLSHGYYCRCGEINGDAMELEDDDIVFAGLPLFHAGGRLIVLMMPLYRGLPVFVEPSFSTSRFFPRASELEATVVIGVGAMGAALLASSTGAHDRDHSVRTMMVAPVSPDDQERFKERFGVERWTDVFGQTECMPLAVTGMSSDARDRAGCGTAASDLEVVLMDDESREVEGSDTGEIYLRPREPFTMFDGYWDRPEETLESVRWLWSTPATTPAGCPAGPWSSSIARRTRCAAGARMSRALSSKPRSTNTSRWRSRRSMRSLRSSERTTSRPA